MGGPTHSDILLLSNKDKDGDVRNALGAAISSCALSVIFIARFRNYLIVNPAGYFCNLHFITGVNRIVFTIAILLCVF